MHYFIVPFIDFIVSQYKSVSSEIEYDDAKMYGETFHFMHSEESCWTDMLAMEDMQKENKLLFHPFLACVASAEEKHQVF